MPEDKQNDEPDETDVAAEETPPETDADEVEAEASEEVEASTGAGDAEAEESEETAGEVDTAAPEASDDGAAAQTGEPSQEGKPPKGPDEAYCSSCGSVIKKEAEVCPECGVRQQSASASATQEKNPALAALLSFIIPGAGQIYNGQIARGAVFLVVFFINILLAFVLIGIFTQLITVVIAVYDAYTQAEKINAGEVEV